MRALAMLCVPVILAAGWASFPAAAQDPKFEYGKAEEVKDPNAVEWKTNAQAGAIYTTGNSRMTTVTVGANASRKAGKDKLSIESGVAYARSSIFVAIDENMSGGISEDEIQEIETTTNRSWLVKARYDRFFSGILFAV